MSAQPPVPDEHVSNAEQREHTQPEDTAREHVADNGTPQLSKLKHDLNALLSIFVVEADTLSREVQRLVSIAQAGSPALQASVANVRDVSTNLNQAAARAGDFVVRIEVELRDVVRRNG